jgi:hypothetical protein
MYNIYRLLHLVYHSSNLKSFITIFPGNMSDLDMKDPVHHYVEIEYSRGCKSTPIDQFQTFSAIQEPEPYNTHSHYNLRLCLFEHMPKIQRIHMLRVITDMLKEHKRFKRIFHHDWQCESDGSPMIVVIWTTRKIDWKTFSEINKAIKYVLSKHSINRTKQLGHPDRMNVKAAT